MITIKTVKCDIALVLWEAWDGLVSYAFRHAFVSFLTIFHHCHHMHCPDPLPSLTPVLHFLTSYVNVSQRRFLHLNASAAFRPHPTVIVCHAGNRPRSLPTLYADVDSVPDPRRLTWQERFLFFCWWRTFSSTHTL